MGVYQVAYNLATMINTIIITITIISIELYIVNPLIDNIVRRMRNSKG